MALKILYTAATKAETDVLKSVQGVVPADNFFRIGLLQVYPLITGIGYLPAAWKIASWLSANPKPDLAINAGIAGSFSKDICNGEVVMPVSECFADAGIESETGFRTLFEAGLSDADEYPFRNGLISLPADVASKFSTVMKPVRAITLGTASGSKKTIYRLVQKFNPDIETMEGAVFFYLCSMESIPFLGIRAISNPVEVRDKNHWDIPLALGKLAAKLDEVFKILNG